MVFMKTSLDMIPFVYAPYLFIPGILVYLAFMPFWPVAGMWFSGFYISVSFYHLVAFLLKSEGGFTGNIKNENQSTPYECGFRPLTPQRTPFSLRFFLISVLFVIFDVEVVLVTSLPIMSAAGVWSGVSLSVFLFFFFLFFSLLFEALKGALDWPDVMKSVDEWWDGYFHFFKKIKSEMEKKS
uniref:NADH-ubiquinone oxidoreductase chain 3 n=1 Tax=Lingula anatina TaxID=7574 RepID=A0A0R7JPF0_LINAN|nr:NADH dehydrogenase subunit 3 [Lingula anatina]